MKKEITTFFFIISFLLLFSQDKGSIVGEWYNAEKDAIVTIFIEGETFSGKITWMKFPNDEYGNPKTDPLNPDKSLRNRPRKGMIMMNNFIHIKVILKTTFFRRSPYQLLLFTFSKLERFCIRFLNVLYWK